MIANNIAILASDTPRTKAYLQEMIRREIVPELCIVYAESKEKLQSEAKNYNDELIFGQYFNKHIPLLVLLETYKLQYILIENKDINSEDIVNCIKNIPQKYLIYSGYGGYILQPKLFKLNKKYIHVHAGILPNYRGSTTAYYSILQEGYMGATAIFLNEQIDQGEIICEERFELPHAEVDIDYIYEPYIRAKVLSSVLTGYINNNTLKSRKQEENNAEVYFIMHPVLKHLAIEKTWSKKRD